MNEADIIQKLSEDFLPNLSTDIVIMGYDEGKIKCLLLQMGEKWMVPGGFVGKTESVDQAVHRALKERTGLEQAHLQFLSVFGNADRSFAKEYEAFTKKKGLDWRPDYWINARFVTLAYYALVDIAKVNPVPGILDEAIAWFDLEELPEFWMDHKQIVLRAQAQLKQDIQRSPITYNLLAEPFTMPQLHQLHQTILGEPLDRSRFQKKMLATDLFERLPQLKKESPGRNPYQYRIKPANAK